MAWTNPYDVPDNAIDRQFFSPNNDGSFGYDQITSGPTDVADDPIDTIMAEFKTAQQRGKR